MQRRFARYVPARATPISDSILFLSHGSRSLIEYSGRVSLAQRLSKQPTPKHARAASDCRPHAIEQKKAAQILGLGFGIPSSGKCLVRHHYSLSARTAQRSTRSFGLKP